MGANCGVMKPGDGEEERELSLHVRFSNFEEMCRVCGQLSALSCKIGCSLLATTGSLKELMAGEREEYSKREQEVLSLLAKGCSYTEIADCLGCKLSTIQTHVKRIYRKMGVHSRAEAVHEACALGIIQI